jgi:ELWxxDGT repeat protein
MKIFKISFLILISLSMVSVCLISNAFAGEKVEMTVELRDDIYSADPRNLHSYGGDLYFTAYNTAGQNSLYRWDGSTAAVVGGSTGASVGSLVEHNGGLYMEALNKIYSLNETTNSIEAAPNWNNTYGGGSPFSLVSVGETLYFGMDTSTHGKELYSYNPTDGLQNAADVAAGSTTSHTQGIVATDTEVYYTACDVGNGSNYQLWSVDSATGQVVENVLNPTVASRPASKYVMSDGRILFGATLDSSYGQEPAIFDPATGQATRLADIDNGTGSSYPKNFVEMDGAVYFYANTGWDDSGDELFVWDEENGVQLAADINPTGSSYGWSNMVQYGNAIYFAAEDDSGDREVWKYDPVNGSEKVTDINTSGGSEPNYFTVVDNVLYFNANDGATGKELWQITGDVKFVDLYLEWMGMPYDSGDVQALLDILTNKSGTYNYGEGAFTYISDALLPGDDGSRAIGEYWEYGGNKYLKTGSGIEYSTSGDDPSVPELPAGMMQMMVLGLGGVLARFRKRG